MKSQFIRRWLPRTRQWRPLAAVLFAVAGLSVTGYCFTPVRQFAAAAFGAAAPSSTDHDGHDAKETLHAHDGEAKHAAAAEDEHDHEHGGKTLYDHKHDEAGSPVAGA